MLKFEELDHVSYSASDFGNGSIDLDLLIAGGSLHCTAHMKNWNDELVVDHVTVKDCVDEEEQPIDCSNADAENVVDAAITANPAILDGYERAVFDAQKLRAKMGELW